VVVRQHQARRTAFERTLEQQPIGYAERTARPAGYQLVPEECAGAVKIRQKQCLVRQRSQIGRDPVDEPAVQRQQEVPGIYQPIQAGSLPCRRNRR